MELPFAVESLPTDNDDASLQHSESCSPVTGSFHRNGSQDGVHFRQHHHNREGGAVIASNQKYTSSNRIAEREYVDQDNDFTYVNVTETDTDEGDDVFFEGVDLILSQDHMRRDMLETLLCGIHEDGLELLLNEIEIANELARQASEAKKEGDIISALDYHTQAAKAYRNNAVKIRERNPSLTRSLLLLSQTQAKSAVALKSIVKLLPRSARDSANIDDSAITSQKERLRAAVRCALSSRHPHEEDISDSQFLGSSQNENATSSSHTMKSCSSTTRCSPNKATQDTTKHDDTRNDTEGALPVEERDHSKNISNPIDEMMELERELRDMDIALQLGNSISSIDVRMQNRMKSSMIGESFMVVPPGSSSYMTSSMWGTGRAANNIRNTTSANRVQNMLEGTTNSAQPSQSTGTAQTTSNKNTHGLESSWWGNNSTTSPSLTSSVMSLGQDPLAGQSHSSSAHTKQIMRLMDSLKTLGDENSMLLREVEELEVARSEANIVKETMKRFKTEYGKRFASLRKALEKYRDGANNTENSPVTTSNYMQNAAVLDQLQHQEQLIRKLTIDLKKEKDGRKKKDSALRKYESFYREVKARSAQKAAQRQSTNSRNIPNRSTQR